MIKARLASAINPPGMRICKGLPGFSSSWSYWNTSAVFALTCRARYSDCGMGTPVKLLHEILFIQIPRNGFHLRQYCRDLSAWHADAVHVGEPVTDHHFDFTP